MLVGAWTQLDLFDLRGLLVPPTLMVLFAELVFVLAIIHNPAHWRLRRRRDLDEIVPAFLRLFQCICRGKDPELLSFRTDDTHFANSDFPIHPQLRNDTTPPRLSVNSRDSLRNVILDQIDDARNRQRAEIGTAAASYSHRARFHFAFSHDQHVRNLGFFRFANLQSDLLISSVALGSVPDRTELLDDRVRILPLFVGNGQYTRLHRR